MKSENGNADGKASSVWGKGIGESGGGGSPEGARRRRHRGFSLTALRWESDLLVYEALKALGRILRAPVRRLQALARTLEEDLADKERVALERRARFRRLVLAVLG